MAAATGLLHLLQSNRDYRWTWCGQLVSEVGDHFNNIAVFALAFHYGGSGAVVAGVLISRAVAVMAAGPLAGVVLDRLNRQHVMIASDLFRALVALSFIAALSLQSVNLLYLLSALLMVASPFFTSGRNSILPTITAPHELHAANTITQTTSWTTTALGAFLGGASVARFGYEWAFVLNALSFLVSAICIARIRPRHGSFQVRRAGNTHPHPFQDLRDGWAYLRRNPPLLGISLIGVGWASGGGAAQILFTLFGEQVWHKGPEGTGIIWGSAGIGLVAGGIFAHWLTPRLSFPQYKGAITIAYIVHGLTYVLFSLSDHFAWALFCIGVSRAAVAVSSTLNLNQLLRRADDAYRGRVFATIETFTWTAMMVSMAAAGTASVTVDPRVIGVAAGCLSSTTAFFWAWANAAGKLPDAPRKISSSALAA